MSAMDTANYGPSAAADGADGLAQLGRLLQACIAGGVRRWHTEPVQKQQNVAQHSFNMVWVLLHITPPEQWTVSLLLAALGHDMGEHETGDVPATTKWDMGPDFVIWLNEIETQARNRIVPSPGVLTEVEQQYIAAADHLEAMLYTLMELSRGNQYAGVWYNRLVTKVHVHKHLNAATEQLYNAIAVARGKGQAGVLHALQSTGFWQ